MKNTNSARYEAAYETFKTVSAKYRSVTLDYRAGKVNDFEFLAAHAELKAAQQAFDAIEAEEIDAL